MDERACLESMCTRKGTVGSNPTLSALSAGAGFVSQPGRCATTGSGRVAGFAVEDSFFDSNPTLSALLEGEGYCPT